jgi:alanine dehydrogenase
MPAAYARTATQALANVTYPYVELLAEHGLGEASRRQPALLSGLNVFQGKLTCRAVAQAHGLPWETPVL